MTKASQLDQSQTTQFPFVNVFSVLDTEWTSIKTIMQWMLEQLENWKPDNEVVEEYDKLKAAAKAKA